MTHYLQLLITDLAANKHVIDEINTLGNEMVRDGHSQTPAIRKRQKEINDK